MNRPQTTNRGTTAGRALAALATLALLLAACSGDAADDSSGPADSGTTQESEPAVSDTSEGESASEEQETAGDGLEEAQSIVQAATDPPAWQGPEDPVDPSASEGKSVWYISFADAIPVLKFWSTTTGNLMEEVGGIEFTLFDGKGQVAEVNRGLDQAIADGADLIMTQALDPQLFAQGFQKAADAGIPVITGNSGTPGITDAGQTAEVSFDYPEVGRLIGAWFVADSEAQGKGLVISSDDVPASDDQWEATLSEVERLCPDCELRVEDVQIASWESRLPTLTRSTITGEPDLEYLMPLYDGMTLPMVGAIRQASATDQVKLGAFNATPSILPNVADESHPLALEVGGANEWWSYAATDAAFRILAGQDAIEDYHIGLRIFTKENIGDIDLEADEATWYGQATYQAEFEALWGVSS